MEISKIILENFSKYTQIYNLYKNDKVNEKDIKNMTGLRVKVIKNNIEGVYKK